MCDNNYIPNYVGQAQQSLPVRLTADEAGKKLARLMESQLGYPDGRIDSVALRLFIRAYWSRVSTYAHAIHDEN